MPRFHYKPDPSRKTGFVNDSEKQRLIDKNEPFEILGIKYKKTGRFAPKFEMNVRFMDNSTSVMSFSAGTVPSRDELLDQAQKFLEENKGDTLVARLSQPEDSEARILTIEED